MTPKVCECWLAEKKNPEIRSFPLTNQLNDLVGRQKNILLGLCECLYVVLVQFYLISFVHFSDFCKSMDCMCRSEIKDGKIPITIKSNHTTTYIYMSHKVSEIQIILAVILQYSALFCIYSSLGGRGGVIILKLLCYMSTY